MQYALSTFSKLGHKKANLIMTEGMKAINSKIQTTFGGPCILISLMLLPILSITPAKTNSSIS